MIGNTSKIEGHSKTSIEFPIPKANFLRRTMSAPSGTPTPSELRSLFAAVCYQYERLSDARDRVALDCSHIHEYVEDQLRQVEALNADFDKIRLELARRRSKPVADRARTTLSPELEPPAPEWQVRVLGSLDDAFIIELTHIFEIPRIIACTAFSRDGSRLAIGADRLVRVYDIEHDTWDLVHEFGEANDPPKHIRCMAWTIDNSKLICGVEDGHVKVFQMGCQRPVSTIEVGNLAISQIVVSNSHDFLLTTSFDGSLRIFQIPEFVAIAQLRSPSAPSTEALCAAISRDDRLIAVGHGDGHICLWDSSSHKLILSQMCHKSGISAVLFLPLQNGLATGSYDMTIKIWNLNLKNREPGLELWKSLLRHTGSVLSLALDPTGQYLLSGSKDRSAILTSTRTGIMGYNMLGHENPVTSVAYSPSGRQFCTASADGVVWLWSVVLEFDNSLDEDDESQS
jgi:WD40 repeat protein